MDSIGPLAQQDRSDIEVLIRAQIRTSQRTQYELPTNYEPDWAQVRRFLLFWGIAPTNLKFCSWRFVGDKYMIVLGESCFCGSSTNYDPFFDTYT